MVPISSPTEVSESHAVSERSDTGSMSLLASLRSRFRRMVAPLLLTSTIMFPNGCAHREAPRSVAKTAGQNAATQRGELESPAGASEEGDDDLLIVNIADLGDPATLAKIRAHAERSHRRQYPREKLAIYPMLGLDTSNEESLKKRIELLEDILRNREKMEVNEGEIERALRILRPLAADFEREERHRRGQSTDADLAERFGVTVEEVRGQRTTKLYAPWPWFDEETQTEIQRAIPYPMELVEETERRKRYARGKGASTFDAMRSEFWEGYEAWRKEQVRKDGVRQR